MFDNQKYWFEASNFESMKELIALHPGKISDLVGQLFMVTKPWIEKGKLTSRGRYLYQDIWQPGHGGIVDTLIFDGSFWSIKVQYIGSGETDFLAMDEIHIAIPLQEFLTHTMPMEEDDYPTFDFKRQAAVNDDVF